MYQIEFCNKKINTPKPHGAAEEIFLLSFLLQHILLLVIFLTMNILNRLATDVVITVAFSQKGEATLSPGTFSAKMTLSQGIGSQNENFVLSCPVIKLLKN